MSRKRLSIITICYNDPDVEKTCKSVVNQTWQDFEWIVIDGGSNEETLRVFEKYKNRIDVFVSESDNGRYDAFNKALEYINSDYVHFLNAGDFYYDDDVLSNVFNKNFGDADILHGDLCFRDSLGKTKERIAKTDYKNINDKFFINKILYHPATFIKSALFNKEDGFRFNEKYKIVGDLEMWIVLARRGVSYFYIPCTISVFDTNGISSNKQYKELHVKEKRELLCEYFSESDIEKNGFKCSFLQKIFSIKNSSLDLEKIITILGFQIKIKRSI